MSAAELEDIPARNEITIPTRLRLPVRQARHLSHSCCLTTESPSPRATRSPSPPACGSLSARHESLPHMVSPDGDFVDSILCSGCIAPSLVLNMACPGSRASGIEVG